MGINYPNDFIFVSTNFWYSIQFWELNFKKTLTKLERFLDGKGVDVGLENSFAWEIVKVIWNV